MTMKDFEILRNQIDYAIRQTHAAALEIAEKCSKGETPSKELLDAYELGKQAVKCTKKNLEEFFTVECESQSF